MKVASNNMTIVDYTEAETDIDNYFFKYKNLEKESLIKKELIKHIAAISKMNPYEAVKANEDYVRTYPFDYIASAYYISSLITIGELDKAAIELRYLINIFNKELKGFIKDGKVTYSSLPEDLIKLSDNIATCTLKLYCYNNQFKKAYEYYCRHWRSFRELAAYIRFYMECQNNIHNVEVDSVLYRQLNNYSEEVFKQTILSKQEKYGKGADPNKACYFDKDFPFEKVYEKVKKWLSESNGLYLGFIDTTYIFRCENCGIAKGKPSDFFKVTVLNGTNNVLDMAPVDGFYELPNYYDFTEFVQGGKVFKK